MKLVNDKHATPVTLTDPTSGGFLVLAAEIGRWAGPVPMPSRTRRRVLAQVAALCARLQRRDDVVEAVAFRGVLRPPGEGAELVARAGVRPARYDVVVLVRTVDADAIEDVRADHTYRAIVAAFDAPHSYEVAADNAARIADVDHTRDDWFLFNYFHCDSAETVYDVWEYTAGWFQHHTALSNSTLLRPLTGDYRVVNHASWPTLRRFLPALTLRPTFRSFVLANFKANGVAAQPVVYRVSRATVAAREPSHAAGQQRGDEQHHQHA